MMTHTLVSFLGRTPRSEDGYRLTTYRLPDGTTEKAAYLGYCLQRWLRPQRLVILGTAGSMWDHLFERDVALDGHEDERLELADAVERKAVTQERLDELVPLLAEARGCNVVLRVIPEALVEDEQVALLQVLAQTTEGAESLSLDITHAYRHLPIIALTAALYLRAAQPDLVIEGLWYGAYQPETDTADVCNLSGLLNISDWITALQRHDWLGDYGAVAELIEDQTVAENLRRATFLESIHQGQQAKTPLREARSRLHEYPLSGPGALFQQLLEERMTWVDDKYLYQRQRAHAVGALDRGDFLRAALYGYEAFITKLTLKRWGSGWQNDPERRELAKDWFKGAKPYGSGHFRQYCRLSDIRNVLAHGNQARREQVQKALASPRQLRSLLEECFAALLPEQAQ